MGRDRLSEEQIFKTAWTIDSPEERTSYIQRTCGEDAALSKRVIALIGAAEDAKDFLEQPAAMFPHDFLRHSDPMREGRASKSIDGADAFLTGLETAPATLGDFRILREIGRGGMGVVYEAQQLSLNRRVALKVLPFAAVLDQRQLQRFKTEAKAAGGLHHPHIVPVFQVGCERAVHFYAMQYIEGQNVAELVGQIRQASGQETAADADRDARYPPRSRLRRSAS